MLFSSGSCGQGLNNLLPLSVENIILLSLPSHAIFWIDAGFVVHYQTSDAILMKKSESKSFELIWIHSYLCCLLFSFPLGMEVLQELFHPSVAGNRLLFAGFRVHAVFQ